MKLHSKRDVAHSQLHEAICLHFERRDAVSIHTLVGAAHQIMRDCASAQGFEYRCVIEEIPAREQISNKAWYKAVFTPRNFFKHADQHSNVILDFDPMENEIWLLDACLLYGQVFQHECKAVTAFWSWYLVKNPEAKNFLTVPSLVPLAEHLGIDQDDWDFFLDHCEPCT